MNYKQIYLPSHPRASSKGMVKEHIVIVEKALGYFLDIKHQVHHFDENPFNNKNNNLVICEDQTYHRLLHFRQKIVKLGGNPNIDIYCWKCKNLKHKDKFNILNSNKITNRSRICQKCDNDLSNNYYHNNRNK